ncbi:unnamed protein product [Echinostoma caproni]|uniref:Peptidase_M1 domain-containing protein n=1 Tax=Echinostoma caproni TaxID=27848 RepID=A0A183B3S4_9TREM|nr:unnamed protein product [Echinostoma caproni]
MCRDACCLASRETVYKLMAYGIEHTIEMTKEINANAVEVGFLFDTEFALFDFDSYSEYHNWRRCMELRTIKSLNLRSHPSEIEE